MGDVDAWQERSNCRQMDAATVDSIYFPESGGKPTKAKQACWGCPVTASCLKAAIEGNLQGFWAGTTEDERRMMRNRFHNLNVKPIGDIVRELIEPELAKLEKRPVYRKLALPPPDTIDYLDSLQGPDVITERRGITYR